MRTYAFAACFLAWEELAYYEKNTRDFLFPEPTLTMPHPGMYREVLMKTAIGFPVSKVVAIQASSVGEKLLGT